MTTNWNKDYPLAASSLSSQALQMRQNHAVIDDALSRMFNYLTDYYLHTLILRTRTDHPTTPASDKGKFYARDTDGKAELWFKDNSGNEVQITSAGSLHVSGKGADVPAGTPCFFAQDTAPTGWTGAAHEDGLLAVKGGSNAYNVAGGNTAGTWTAPTHALTEAEMAAHDHTIQVYEQKKSTNTSGNSYRYISGSPGSKNTGDAGSGTAHSHGSDTYRPYAITGIIATRDA